MPHLKLARIRLALGTHEPRVADRSATGRLAAVAVVLRPVPDDPDDTEVLLIRRAERDGDPWSGHMAFPGGHVDPGDASIEAAARRETLEEVGLDLRQHGRLVAPLDVQAPTLRAMRIQPYVYEVRGDPALVPEPDEVAEAFWAPLRPMLLGESLATLTWHHGNRPEDYPGYAVDGGHIVWGLTYRMLQTLFQVIHPEWQRPEGS